MTSLVFVFSLSVLRAELPKSPPLVPGSVPLSEPYRYEIPRSYDETLDYYRRVFRRTGGVRWRSIVNAPAVRAKHVQSLRRNTDWTGLNIYEHKGRVRVYVLMREKPTATSRRGRKNVRR